MLKLQNWFSAYHKYLKATEVAIIQPKILRITKKRRFFEYAGAPVVL